MVSKIIRTAIITFEFQVLNFVKMTIARYYNKTMLTCDSRNPDIIFWNRLSFFQ